MTRAVSGGWVYDGSPIFLLLRHSHGFRIDKTTSQAAFDCNVHQSNAPALVDFLRSPCHE
jgi:hypothetical protein